MSLFKSRGSITTGFNADRARRQREESTTIRFRKQLKEEKLFKSRQIRTTDGLDKIVSFEVLSNDDDMTDSNSTLHASTPLSTFLPLAPISIIKSLNTIDEEEKSEVSPLDKAIYNIRQNSEVSMLTGLCEIQKLLSNENTGNVEFEKLVQYIISNGLVPRFISLMIHSSSSSASDNNKYVNGEIKEKIRLISLWIIGNISSSLTKSHLDALVRNDVILSLNHLLFSSLSGDVHKYEGQGQVEVMFGQIFFCLQNLSLEDRFREQIAEQIEMDKFPILMKTFKKIETVQKMIDFLKNLFVHFKDKKNKFLQLPERYVHRVMPLLTSCFEQLHSVSGESGDNIVLQVLNIFRVLLIQNSNIKIVAATNLEKLFLKFCLHEDLKIKLEAIKLICNIVSGTDDDIERMIELGAIQVWKKLLFDPSIVVKVPVLISLANVCSSQKVSHISLLMTSGIDILPKIIDMLYNDEKKCKEEVIWCLHNICTKSSNQEIHTVYLIENHALTAIGQYISQHMNTKELERCLESLYEMLSVIMRNLVLLKYEQEEGKEEGKEQKMTPTEQKFTFDKNEKREMLEKYLEKFEETGAWEVIDKLLDHGNEKIDDLANSLHGLQEKFEEMTF
jgi:hypothetical protein